MTGVVTSSGAPFGTTVESREVNAATEDARAAAGSPRIRVLELRSVRGTGGGPEKTILLGAALANRSRFDVTVCYLFQEGDAAFQLAERAAALGLDYIQLPERHALDPSIWSRLVSIVRDRSIDLIHAHEYKTNLLALLLAARTGALAMSTAHGWSGYSLRERRLYYPVDKRLLARFPCVVAVSGPIQAELIARGMPRERIRLLWNAIDPSVFRCSEARRAAVRRQHGFGPDEIVVGAVGRLEIVKRFDVLLDAVSRLRSADGRYRLAIVGDGSLKSDLLAHASRLGIAGFCTFFGHREDVIDLYQAFDVFVQSSDSEGAPNAVLEAMAMEVPIVATDVGGTRELAWPNAHALLVPRQDPAALAAGVEAVVADPAAARVRAAAARTRIETDLSFEARTRHLEDIYAALIERRRCA